MAEPTAASASARARSASDDASGAACANELVRTSNEPTRTDIFISRRAYASQSRYGSHVRGISLATAVCAIGTATSAAVAAMYLRANGITAGSLALGSLPVLCMVFAVAVRSRRHRRRALRVAALLVACDLAWTVARCVRPPGEGLRACVDERCDGRGAFWQRVPDEREAARAGLYLSAAMGHMEGKELHDFDRLLDLEYAKLPAAWSGLPNALLLRSTHDRIESQRWIPPGAKNAPCIVFLHGYGGALTPYVRAMVESDIGAHTVIVAPALDNLGDWAGSLDVVERIVRDLPPEVDRAQIYLVGLSNGAVGAAQVLSEPALRAHFAGIVLVSGAAPLEGNVDLHGFRVLMVAGRNDPRFAYDWIVREAAEYGAAGAQVELVDYDADHFLMLTHADAWTRRYAAWATSPAAVP